MCVCLVRLTGSKYGCGGGGCGACTVMVSRYDPQTKSIKYFILSLYFFSFHHTALSIGLIHDSTPMQKMQALKIQCKNASRVKAMHIFSSTRFLQYFHIIFSHFFKIQTQILGCVFSQLS